MGMSLPWTVPPPSNRCLLVQMGVCHLVLLGVNCLQLRHILLILFLVTAFLLFYLHHRSRLLLGRTAA